MKKKKVDWSRVPWTTFTEVSIPRDPVNDLHPPVLMLVNSRYQVTVYIDDVEPFGRVAHLSFKVHDRQPHHDWRDLQRIKNEICGPEHDAVEIYPAESKLVDTSNQYHLWVFNHYKLPFGFQERLVGEETWQQSVQRPFDADNRPSDCLTAQDYQTRIDAGLAKKARQQGARDGSDDGRTLSEVRGSGGTDAAERASE